VHGCLNIGWVLVVLLDRDLRRGGHMGEFVHVHLAADSCYISCDGGRVCRPVIICDKVS